MKPPSRLELANWGLLAMGPFALDAAGLCRLGPFSFLSPMVVVAICTLRVTRSWNFAVPVLVLQFAATFSVAFAASKLDLNGRNTMVTVDLIPFPVTMMRPGSMNLSTGLAGLSVLFYATNATA
ncbi:MAG TPA: hypothetical protein VEJ63_03295 [Planctomycetota bacterium]|nr:hypothetical protein [Planctomycetota bacterium]